ncbi:adhesion G protein-coupled receptor E4P, partial [Biomphalaria glabrata]
GRCLKMYCTEGKHLSDDDCVENINDVAGIEYTLNMLFVLGSPHDQVTWSKFKAIFSQMELLQLFTLNIEFQLHLLSSKYKIEILIKEGNYPCILSQQTDNSSHVTFITQGTIMAPENYSRTQFEQKLISNLMRKDLCMYLSPTDFVQLQPIVILRQSVFSKYSLFQLCGIEQNIDHQYYHLYENRYRSNTKISSSLPDQKEILISLDVLTYETHLGLSKPYFSNRVYLSQILVCKFVSFNQTDYQMTINDSVIPQQVSITISLNVTEVHITDNKELIMIDINKNGRLDVCTDLLDLKIKGNNNKQINIGLKIE